MKLGGEVRGLFEQLLALLRRRDPYLLDEESPVTPVLQYDAGRSTAHSIVGDLLAIRADGAAATPIATPVATLSRDARELVEQILRFWYLGTWDDQPVTDRAGFWFGLSAWQAVEYTYAPSVCRAFGIWAEPPPGQS